MILGLVPAPRDVTVSDATLRPLSLPAEVRIDPDAGTPPEGYRLRIGDGRARIEASDAAGAFYARQTLRQLVQVRGGETVAPEVSIEDAPRFAYRGVMLDVARHFFPPEIVQAYIDRAAALKFNVLHLHLSDDQGWRLELRSRPELTRRASATAVGGDAGGFYTQEEYRSLVRYAAERHMTVVPEFDMPGHTHAVGLAHPELVEEPVLSAHVAQTAAEFGGGLPATGVPYTGLAVGFSSLRIHHEATYDFVRDVFDEVAALTPGPYLHFGGDEALGTSAEDFAVFVRRAAAIVAGTGKTPIAWHEAGVVEGLPAGTVGQYWGFVQPVEGTDATARRFVDGGGRIILSPADAVYLDMKPDAESALGLTWANGPTSLERAYAWEPREVVAGIEEADVLGVEAPLWTETVRTLADIDALAFPRIAAAAEIAWSPAPRPDADTSAGPARTWESFRDRVALLSELWARDGVGLGDDVGLGER